jgi:hypothetical protein
VELEGTVQLPLAVYETLREATKHVAVTQEAKKIEIDALASKVKRLEQAAEEFEMILSVWTKHMLGGKEINNEAYGKRVQELANSFNAQGLIVEIEIEAHEGKFYVKPINKSNDDQD